MTKKLVYIIGSKPNSILPNQTPDEVYAVNGASTRARELSAPNGTYRLTVKVGAGRLINDASVRENLIKARPEKIIYGSQVSRRDPNSVPIQSVVDINWPCEIVEKKFLEGYKEMRQLFSFFDVVKAESMQLKYNNNYKLNLGFGIRYNIKRILKSGSFLYDITLNKKYVTQGFSAGFYALLQAKNDFPDSVFVLAGIGVTGGLHHHGVGLMSIHRAMIDKYLVSKLPKDFTNNVYTTDLELASASSIQLWENHIK